MFFVLVGRIGLAPQAHGWLSRYHISLSGAGAEIQPWRFGLVIILGQDEDQQVSRWYFASTQNHFETFQALRNYLKGYALCRRTFLAAAAGYLFCKICFCCYPWETLCHSFFSLSMLCAKVRVMF